jgi:hypothetical protein
MIKEVEADNIPLHSTDAADEELPPETVAVPNLLASKEELSAIRQQLGVPAAAIRIWRTHIPQKRSRTQEPRYPPKRKALNWTFYGNTQALKQLPIVSIGISILLQ